MEALVIKLKKATYAALQRQAETKGLSPSKLVASSIERQFGDRLRSSSAEEARERFERHFGSVDLGQATGADNESIDADLAREYSATHEKA
jgi:hypothetical protein